MSKFQSPLLNLTRPSLQKSLGPKTANWVRRGILAFGWDDRRRTGVIRARTVKCRPETLKWDEPMNFVPWLIDGPEAGWTPTPGPVLPWPGMSSSSGVEVPQQMAVEPVVRRRLKRASEGEPEIAEICSWISDVNENEEPHWQSV